MRKEYIYIYHLCILLVFIIITVCLFSDPWWVDICNYLVPTSFETIVRLPAEVGPVTAEGLVERKQLVPGVCMVESLVRIVDG